MFLFVDCRAKIKCHSLSHSKSFRLLFFASDAEEWAKKIVAKIKSVKLKSIIHSLAVNGEVQAQQILSVHSDGGEKVLWLIDFFVVCVCFAWFVNCWNNLRVVGF